MYKNYNKVKRMSRKNENKCNYITNYQSNNMTSNKYKNTKNNIITNKSLTLDILERNKTIERVINLCNISE